MSDENVATFQRIIEAFARGDLDQALRDVDPEVVFEPQRAATEGAFVGHAGVRRFWEDTQEMFEVFDADYGEVRDIGNGVLAAGTLTVKGRGSGVEIAIPMAFVARFRDGALVHYKDYGDVGLALEAARLPE